MEDELSEAARAAHAAAMQRGENGYLDPATGLFVMTARALIIRGSCCGNGCRHCPYPAEAQRQAGRPQIRSEER